MKLVTLALLGALAATSAAAETPNATLSSQNDEMRIVHSEPGEIRISSQNDSR